MDQYATAALSPSGPEFRDLAADLQPFGADAAELQLRDGKLRALRNLAQEETQRLTGPQFSLGRTLQHMAERRPIDPIDRVIGERASARVGQGFDRDRIWLPWGALGSRAMSTQPGSKGGYAVGVETLAAVDVLRPWSVTASSGLQIITDLRDQVAIPSVASEPTATWQGGEGVSVTDSEPSLGLKSATPKTIITLVRVPLQLLKQGAAVDGLLQTLLSRAIGAALDRAVFSGTGGAQPLGLFSASGIGTQSGSSLSHAGTLSMRKSVLDAGGQESRLTWIGAPDSQLTLGGRERFSGGGVSIWGDGILNRPAFATNRAPAGSLTIGDFSTGVVTVFGPGIQLAADPSALFNSGGMVLRAMFFADVVYPTPSAFCVATSIT